METRCINCRSLFVIKRNPNQRYCSKPECQRARKSHWQKEKVKDDDDYQANQKQADRHWRTKHSAYWQKYREQNPAYTQRNRQQSRMRWRQHHGKKTRQAEENFAKMDALVLIIPIKSAI